MFLQNLMTFFIKPIKNLIEKDQADHNINEFVRII